MVGRQLLAQPRQNSLGGLRSAIQEAGAELSLSQVSKAVRAMEEDLVLSKPGRNIMLQDPLRLIDRLGDEWPGYPVKRRQALRLPAGVDWAEALNSIPNLRWTATGESSARRYTAFSQGGPIQLAVSNLPLAEKALRGTPEDVISYADLELKETDEAGLFFSNEVDETGKIWASRLQTWLELQKGDGRQQEAAKEIKEQLFKRVKR
jgi:hypothetical protein